MTSLDAENDDARGGDDQRNARRPLGKLCEELLRVSLWGGRFGRGGIGIRRGTRGARRVQVGIERCHLRILLLGEAHSRAALPDWQASTKLGRPCVVQPVD